VPKSLVQDLINSGVTADIGGDRREMSFMFTDVRDFTPMAESTPAEELMAQMSQYFDGLVFDILERGGTVDKYVGDAIFAYWNAPVRQHNHPDLACLAALACRATSNKLNSSFQDAGRNTWYTRLGVHLGEAVVGNVGSRDRMDYTVVGNAVNIASRLEGLNKFYGTQILASGQVVDRLGDRFVARFLDVVSPKGAGAPVRVFELLGTAAAGPLAATAHDRALCRSWGAIVAAYQCRDWTKARETVAAFAAAYPNDPVAGVFADRIEHFIAAPPPTEWDGVTRFESK
jgi:adenylate cyclase